MSVGPPLAQSVMWCRWQCDRGPVTAGEGTAPVPGGQGDGLAGGGDPGGPAEVERDALAVLDQHVQLALVAASEGVPDRDQGAVLGDREPVPVAQLVVSDVPDDRGRGAAAGGQVPGVEDGFEDVTERVVHPHLVRAFVPAARHLHYCPSPHPSSLGWSGGRPIRARRVASGGGYGGGGFGPGVQHDPGGFAGFLVQVGLQGVPGLPAFLPQPQPALLVRRGRYRAASRRGRPGPSRPWPALPGRPESPWSRRWPSRPPPPPRPPRGPGRAACRSCPG